MPDMPAVQDLELAYYLSLFDISDTVGKTLPDLRYMYYLAALSGTLPGGGGGTFPDRLAPEGQEVIDWNAVAESGFYWSDGNALHEPVPGSPAQGVVTVGYQGNVEQALTVVTENPI